MNTHANVVYGLSGKRPVEVDIMLRALKFSFSCLNSENHIVRNVSRHAAFVLRTSSGFGRNFIQCCQRFHVVVSTPDYYYNLNCDFVLQNLKKKRLGLLPPVFENLEFIYELLMLRENVFELSTNCLGKSELGLILNLLCTV
jgi:hypothetical protein